MIFVDSGFLLALAQPADALHLRALAWASCIAEPLLISEYVLWEVVNYLSRTADRGRAHLITSHVTSDEAYEVIYASRDLFEAGLKLHRERPDKEWSLTDCISFHLMHERGMGRALAYDQHFEQAGFESLLRFDPPK